MATTLLVAGSTLTFWIPPFASTSSFKVLGCLCNCRQLAYSSFQLTHMSHDDHAIELIEPWRPRRRQNIITVLATLPQVWVYACKHQCTTAITRMWTKSLLVFFESYTAESCAQAMADNGVQTVYNCFIWVWAVQYSKLTTSSDNTYRQTSTKDHIEMTFGICIIRVLLKPCMCGASTG